MTSIFQAGLVWKVDFVFSLHQAVSGRLTAVRSSKTTNCAAYVMKNKTTSRRDRKTAGQIRHPLFVCKHEATIRRRIVCSVQSNSERSASDGSQNESCHHHAEENYNVEAQPAQTIELRRETP